MRYVSSLCEEWAVMLEKHPRMHLTVTSLQNSLMFGFIDAFLNLISEAHCNELLQTVLNESPAAEHRYLRGGPGR